MRGGITMRKTVTKRLPLFYIDVPAVRPGTVGAYAFAFVSVGIATALRLAVDPYVVGAQFVTFFPAIVITTLSNHPPAEPGAFISGPLKAAIGGR
jgi:hypothetical protein